MVKIGMMIADRYEVLEKIGTGGMSDVYKAKDHKLNRPVAVKVLKQEFAENANFVSKFRVEAQAAAGLMHPNIVNVYDVGDENGTYYIVMELVEGVTLKKYIEKKARLSIKEAVTIAIQIGMGIEAAHNNHIIHRDIKPQNVIISKEGKVKVTDFGIAKAATSNTITSNVMGSVHYTSPEQARGGFSDEKSDVYSLGITLFEMLTGRVPFNGDTTVAIAIKQIQEEMPSPREFVSEIPISVEQIVLKCTQKSPDRRYQSMGELIEDLKKSFITPDDDFVKHTEEAGGETRTVTAEDLEALKKNVKSEPVERVASGSKSKKRNDDEYDPKMERITTILAIVVGILICAVAIFLIGKTVGIFKLGKTSTVSPTSISMDKPVQVVMPEVLYKDYQKALDALKLKGLSGRIVWEESEEYEKNVVIGASVKEGLKVDEGSEIILTVSSGTTSVFVPDVVGYSLNAGNKAIMTAGLLVNIEQDFSDKVAEGLIISQSPDGGEKVPEESTITIVVSLGRAENLVPMPSLLGESEEHALEILTDEGFSLSPITYVYNNVYAPGFVCYQNISAGQEVPKTTTIDIQVSKGPEPQQVETYSYKASILAPSTAEDPDYTAGTEVHIVIKTNDGTPLYDYSTASFPLNVNLWNITGSSGGTIKLSYLVTLPGESVTDPETGEVTVLPGESEERFLVREIFFVKESQ